MLHQYHFGDTWIKDDVSRANPSPGVYAEVLSPPRYVEFTDDV